MKQNKLMLGKEAIDFLKKYGIPTVKTTRISRPPSVNPPFVLKAISPKIVHKAKHKAVEVIYSKEKVGPAYSRLKKLGEVILQPFATGFELIIGVKRDELFGHVLLFGTGGPYVEAVNDVAFRSIPLTRKDALSMIMDTQAYRLLCSGGRKPNLALLQDTIMKVNMMVLENPEVDELDINPFMFNGQTGLAVDARIIKR